MTRIWRYAAAALVVGLIAAGGMMAMHGSSAPPADLDLSRSKSSEKDVFLVSVEPEAGSFRQGELHSWVLTVKKPDGTPVEDASIAVDGGMPDHNHGLPTSPKVTAHIGEGRYRVEGVKFNMGGWWVLRFAISSPAGADEAVFNLTL
ncbi:FixH family protein [Allomesorhizobium alhagi]|uniref:FixH family protein n=1 Tax=Allomesorhizobium alhagi TaxID=475067 RepID=UPI00058F0133|nr:FixH family protein [Mesorhizobium alhagi]